jgi:hypothetical protein
MDIASPALLGEIGAIYASSPQAFGGIQGSSGLPIDGRPYATDAWYGYSQINRHAAARITSPALWGAHSAVARPEPKTLPGHKSLSFQDDWYYRFHVHPDLIDFGLVTTSRSAAVWLWNAWFDDLTIVSMTGQIEGLSLTAPATMRGLSEQTIHVNITAAGPAIVNTQFGPVFDNGDIAIIHVLASRQAIAWFFAPTWANGIRERLTWATDILRSESMAEQRRALRTAPRRTFDLDFIVTGRARQRLELALGGIGARAWLAPIWYDIQFLAVDLHAGELYIPCRTLGHAFRAGSTAVLVIGDTSDAVRISAVSPTSITIVNELTRDWPAGTRLYPGMSVRLSGEPMLTRQSDNTYTLSASFTDTEPIDLEAIPPPDTYRGRPILTQRPNEAESLTRQFVRLLATLDSGLSASAQVTDVSKRALPMLAWRWIGNGREAHNQYNALLYWLAGRFRALWVPSWGDDLTLAAPIAPADTSINIHACGYSLYAFDRPGRRDIRIELTDGAVYYRCIVAAVEIPDGGERLTLDSAFGRAIALSDIVRISWLVLSRSDNDAIEIEHITDAEGVARSEIIFQAVRDDEF